MSRGIRSSLQSSILFAALLLLASRPALALRKPDPPGGGGGGCYPGPVGAQINLPNGPFTTSETGGGGQFTVKLTAPPTGTVYTVVKVMDTTEGRIYVQATNMLYTYWNLYFDASNWDVPQWITVVGIKDCEMDGNVTQAFSVFNSQITPECPMATLNVVNTDAPSARLTVYPGSGSTSESGTIATFGASIVSDAGCTPTSNVTLTATTNDASEGLVRKNQDPFSTSTSFTLTPADFQTSRSLDVKGQRDGLPDGNVGYSVVFQTTSADPRFSGFAAQISLTNVDVPLADDTCYTRCGAGVGAVGAPPAGCSCAVDCGYQGNCCVDVIAECSGIASPFVYPHPLAYGAGSEYYVASPKVAATVSPSSEGPSGPGLVLEATRTVAPVSRSFAGLTTIGLHHVNAAEERTECRVDPVGGMWKLKSWVNWSSTGQDAGTQCSARALSIPNDMANPPTIRQIAHAQDVGAQSPQEVDMGPVTSTSFAMLTGVKFENVNLTSTAKCLIYPSGGNWKLTAEGNGPTADMWCDAQVLTWPASAGLTVSGPYAVTAEGPPGQTDEREVYMGRAQGRLCFMTDVLYNAEDYGGHASGEGSCDIDERNDGYYLKATSGKYMGVTCSADCLQFASAWPPAPTLAGVVGPGETPAPGTDAGVDGSGARVNLYQTGAYDKPLVMVEGFDPVDNTGPAQWIRLFSPTFRELQQRGVDLWVVNVSGNGNIASLVSREVAKAIGMAYTYDPDGAGPLPPWNVGNPGKKVAVVGFSQGGLDTRVALASWEDGRFAPGGALPVPGLPNASGPPPVSLFASVNGPQDGAEASLGLQHVVNDIANSFQAVGLALPETVTKMVRSTPATQMLRQLGDSNAAGVVTESCGWFGFGADTVRGPASSNDPPYELNVYGSSWTYTTGTHDAFQYDIDARGSFGNGFPQSVYSVGFSNGSFSPQGCANTEPRIPCTGDPLVWGAGTGAGSIYTTIQFTDTGHQAPTGGTICQRNTKIVFDNTAFDTEGGDLNPGRMSALADIPAPFAELKLLKAEDRVPLLFIPTESALYCHGAAAASGCSVLDSNGQRDHDACDAVCRASNRNAASPRFRNVFSNTTNKNGSHYNLDGRLSLTALAYFYEYLVADADGYFGAANPYLTGGQPPAGEASDCDDADPTRHACGP